MHWGRAGILLTVVTTVILIPVWGFVRWQGGVQPPISDTTVVPTLVQSMAVRQVPTTKPSISADLALPLPPVNENRPSLTNHSFLSEPKSAATYQIEKSSVVAIDDKGQMTPGTSSVVRVDLPLTVSALPVKILPEQADTSKGGCLIIFRKIGVIKSGSDK